MEWFEKVWLCLKACGSWHNNRISSFMISKWFYLIVWQYHFLVCGEIWKWTDGSQFGEKVKMCNFIWCIAWCHKPCVRWSQALCLQVGLAARSCTSMWITTSSLLSESLALLPYKRLQLVGVLLKKNGREQDKTFTWKRPGSDMEETKVIGEEVPEFSADTISSKQARFDANCDTLNQWHNY